MLLLLQSFLYNLSIAEILSSSVRTTLLFFICASEWNLSHVLYHRIFFTATCAKSLNFIAQSKVKDIELKGHTDSVDQLCWDPNHPDTVATAAADKSIRLWDARSGKCQIIELSGENINITYKHDGSQIAVGNKEDELTILDVRTLKVVKKHKANYEMNEIAWNKAGDLFYITTGLGHIEVVKDLEFLKPCKLNAHTAGCYCIAMDPLDRYFAVGSADSLVSLWNVKELLCIRTFTKLEWPVRTVSFNHTGEFIAYASEDPFIDIANVETGRSIHQIPCKAAMNSVEWNPKYNLLAYAGDDKKYQADEGMVAAVQSFSLACIKKWRKRVKTTPVNSWAILL